jgi:hypothetical protein
MFKLNRLFNKGQFYHLNLKKCSTTIYDKIIAKQLPAEILYEDEYVKIINLRH